MTEELAPCRCGKESVQPGRRVGKLCRAKAEADARVARKAIRRELPCSIEGCQEPRVELPSQVLPWCASHRTNRPPRHQAPVGMRRCGQCGFDRPLADFGLIMGSPDHMCREHRRATQRRYENNRSEQVKMRKAAFRRKKAWGQFTYKGREFTEDDFDVEFLAQAGRCKLCHEEFRTDRWPDVDHDHVTGQFRGLLCGSHNKALGLFRDDPDALRLGADYIEAHRMMAEIDDDPEPDDYDGYIDWLKRQ